MKILIANRGEIALRIIRAAHELNIPTVAVYAKADEESLHVKLADEAYCIGEKHAFESYLHMENIISAAVLSGADYIHPGYGFLSESPLFRKLLKACNIGFIGPSEETLLTMGDKASAKALARKAGVPVVPGSIGEVSSLEEAKALAKDIGYPLLFKASSGGGGKGIRLVEQEEDLQSAYLAVKKEALANFGEEGLYMEKYLEAPRHIEFQILRDVHGQTVHLFDRDCSLQRRKQKVLEEAPSPNLSKELREAMGKSACALAEAADYLGAGTVEFLLDREGHFYFMEMNTRIQVEHPVTEMITGMDLIKEQIYIAEGKPLSFSQEDLTIRGHAMECRINAEDPEEDFRPSPGTITFLHFPSGKDIRVDSACYTGLTISPYYDAMVGKIIVHGATREEARRKMKSALYELTIEGIKTNRTYQEALLETTFFKEATYDTMTLEHHGRR